MPTCQIGSPHSSHLGQGARRPREMMDYAGDRLKHLHTADVFDHTANVGNRYIMNPPGVDARIHQHNEIGTGEIDWADALAYLRERGDAGPVSVGVFGWVAGGDASTRRTRARGLAALGGGRAPS